MRRLFCALALATSAACAFGDPVAPLEVSGLRDGYPDGGFGPMVMHLDVCERPPTVGRYSFVVLGGGFEPRLAEIQGYLGQGGTDVSGPQVTLVGNGGGVIPADSVAWGSSAMTINLVQIGDLRPLGVDPGTYDLRIDRNDGPSATLPQAITVLDRSTCAQ